MISHHSDIEVDFLGAQISFRIHFSPRFPQPVPTTTFSPFRQVDLKSFDVEALASVVFWGKNHGTENLNKIDRPPRGWSLISASRLLPLYLMELGALSETDFARIDVSKTKM